MAILERGSLVQVVSRSDLRDAVVTEIDGPYCEIVYTDGLESDPHWVLSCGFKRVYEEKWKPRFKELVRGMYVKIPFKSRMVWATILAVGANYTLISYEENTTVNFVVNGCLKDCFVKAEHPRVKLEEGDHVHLPLNTDYCWGCVLAVDGEYVSVILGITGKEECVLRGSIVAKTVHAKKEKIEKTVQIKNQQCVIL